jgi:hypothetical protein
MPAQHPSVRLALFEGSDRIQSWIEDFLFDLGMEAPCRSCCPIEIPLNPNAAFLMLNSSAHRALYRKRPWVLFGQLLLGLSQA